jgi:hypothetical protein
MNFDAANIISLFTFLNPTQSASRRVFRAGELLNDSSAGSASDVRAKARMEMTEQRESRNERAVRLAAERNAEEGRVTSPSFGSHTLQSFQIPNAIRA